jgi:hypothetical protein
VLEEQSREQAARRSFGRHLPPERNGLDNTHVVRLSRSTVMKIGHSGDATRIESGSCRHSRSGVA